jgi:hypothetical protein
MAASSLLVVAVLALGACRADPPAVATPIAVALVAPTRAPSFPPAAPSLAPPTAAATDLQALVGVLAEGIEVDEPRSSRPSADPMQSTIAGVVRDLETGDTLAGVTVIATSPALTGELVAITDENGGYELTALPATYTVTLYWVDNTLEETDVVVSAGHAIYLADTMPTLREPPPTIDGQTIQIPSRTFEAVLGAAAGSQEDGPGVTFSGECLTENSYVIN